MSDCRARPLGVVENARGFSVSLLEKVRTRKETQRVNIGPVARTGHMKSIMQDKRPRELAWARAAQYTCARSSVANLI